MDQTTGQSTSPPPPPPPLPEINQTAGQNTPTSLPPLPQAGQAELLEDIRNYSLKLRPIKQDQKDTPQLTEIALSSLSNNISSDNINTKTKYNNRQNENDNAQDQTVHNTSANAQEKPTPQVDPKLRSAVQQRRKVVSVSDDESGTDSNNEWDDDDRLNKTI